MADRPLTSAEHALWALLWTACANAMERDVVLLMRGRGPYNTSLPKLHGRSLGTTPEECEENRMKIFTDRAARLAVISGKMHQRSDEALDALWKLVDEGEPPFTSVADKNWLAHRRWSCQVGEFGWWNECPWCNRGAARAP